MTPATVALISEVLSLLLQIPSIVAEVGPMITALQGMVSENRDPTPEEFEAIKTQMAAAHAKLQA